jgi:hypothetical protein
MMLVVLVHLPTALLWLQDCPPPLGVLVTWFGSHIPFFAVASLRWCIPSLCCFTLAFFMALPDLYSSKFDFPRMAQLR